MKKFVLITPYSNDPQFEQKKQIVTNLAKKHGLQLLMPDWIENESPESVQKTLDILNEVDFAIADLSYERPSCYYEVGYLQGLNKTVYLLAQGATTIHLITGEIQWYNNTIDYQNIIAGILKSNRIH